MIEAEVMDDPREEKPFLLVTQSEQVKCAKCGAEMPSPGRIAIKTEGAARYYCDCITEDEMDEIVMEWNSYVKLMMCTDEVEN